MTHKAGLSLQRGAMLFQRQPQLFHIPVFQVLSLGLEGPMPRRRRWRMCDALELAPLLARDFSRLSGGAAAGADRPHPAATVATQSMTGRGAAG